MAVEWPPWSGGGSGGGGVETVNADPGPDVVLDALDVGAVASTTSANRLYGTTSAGNPSSFPYSQTAGVNTIAQRGTNGVLAVGEPTAGAHATTKTYVDAIQTALDSRLDALEAGAVMSDGSVTDLVSKTAAEMAGITPDATTVYAVTP